MSCGACGLTWDHKDPEPPACNPEPAPKLRELPAELPAHVAVRMHMAYSSARASDTGMVAMRAAYRELKRYMEK